MSDPSFPSKLVSLRGHGWVFSPRVPFEIGRFRGDDVVFVHHGSEQPKVRIAVQDGQVGVQLGPGTQAPEDVLLDFYDGEPIEAPGWTVVFEAGYGFEWPAGSSLWSTDDSVNWAIELTPAGRPPDEMLYVQGPFSSSEPPDLSALVAPGMNVVSRPHLEGAFGPIRGIELSYVHDGQSWHQWRYLVPLSAHRIALLTAQASVDGLDAMRTLSSSVAQQLRAL